MAEKKKMMESAAPAADKKKALETAMAQIARGGRIKGNADYGR